MEVYRSGHNENDSKSFCLHGHVGSNPTVSACRGVALTPKKLLTFVFCRCQFFLYIEIFIMPALHKDRRCSIICMKKGILCMNIMIKNIAL